MERPRRPLILLAILLVVLIGAYAKYREDAALTDAQAGAIEAKFAPTTALQFWAAGYRSSDGTFCSACSPHPTLLYETSDAAEVHEVLSKFRYRRRPSGEPEVAVCGHITVCFLRDGKVLHSCNLKVERLENESWEFMQSWLNKRDLVNKAIAVRYPGYTAPKKDP